MKVIHIVGARPNFMKIAPIMDAMRRCGRISQILVHTGQHYDPRMSKVFFEELGMPRPEVNLKVGSASHAVQTAQIMERCEPVLLREKPDVVVVVGDVNSTIACALACAKLCIPVAHVEAGLRSFDRTMPEEINRVLTDAISEFLFITEKSAEQNLLREGVRKENIHFVGNVMIDTLIKHRAKADSSNILSRVGVKEKSYGLVTIHRPSNVGQRGVLEGILRALREISKEIPLIFPCHPRTRERVEALSLSQYINKEVNGRASKNVNLYQPFGYLDFLKLMAEARIVLTDSGGIQEETTILGIPCLTLRENTERPVTVAEGTNSVVGVNRETIVKHALAVLNGDLIQARTPKLWDGKASERIVNVLTDHFLG